MLSCVAPNVACIWGKATFAIVESSTCISVPAITAMVISPLRLTFNGAKSAEGVAAIDLQLRTLASNERAGGVAFERGENGQARCFLYQVSIGILFANYGRINNRTTAK